ncbi:MAG: hypothetical protein OEY77_00030 [Nitrospira sp.]|nr:hypothetical protein [Nitrospira sp.]
MYKTEAEMKKLVCWQTMGADAHENCIASKCAAWRWAIEFPERQETQRRGYCGLAGRPE